MERPPSWHACAALPADAPHAQSEYARTVDGVSYTLVTPTTGPPPAQISRLVVPMSKEWCCDTELVAVRPTASETRSSPRSHRVEHRARQAGTSPGDARWAVGLVLIEQPVSTYAEASLVHTDNLSYEHWDADRLLGVLARREQRVKRV